MSQVKATLVTHDAAEAEMFLVNRALEPGLDPDERRYREYARDFGIIVNRALTSRDSVQMLAAHKALVDSLGILVGNIAVILENNGPAFVLHCQANAAQRVGQAAFDVLAAAERAGVRK